MRIFIVIVVLLWAVPGVAQLPKNKSLRFFCLFNQVASPEGIADAKEFRLEFLFDKITKEAIMVGNQGFTKVAVLQGSYAITFVETLKTGVAQTTTIVKTSQKAVHSRHTVIGGLGIVPSQYYGACRIG
jgi:hypothetical protein